MAKRDDRNPHRIQGKTGGDRCCRGSVVRNFVYISQTLSLCVYVIYYSACHWQLINLCFSRGIVNIYVNNINFL